MSRNHRDKKLYIGIIGSINGPRIGAAQRMRSAFLIWRIGGAIFEKSMLHAAIFLSPGIPEQNGGSQSDFSLPP